MDCRENDKFGNHIRDSIPGPTTLNAEPLRRQNNVKGVNFYSRNVDLLNIRRFIKNRSFKYFQKVTHMPPLTPPWNRPGRYAQNIDIFIRKKYR